MPIFGRSGSCVAWQSEGDRCQSVRHSHWIHIQIRVHGFRQIRLHVFQDNDKRAVLRVSQDCGAEAVDDPAIPDEVTIEPFRGEPSKTILVARIQSSFPRFNRYVWALIGRKYLLE